MDDQFSFEANSSEISASKGFLSVGVTSSLLRGENMVGFLGESADWLFFSNLNELFGDICVFCVLLRLFLLVKSQGRNRE